MWSIAAFVAVLSMCVAVKAALTSNQRTLRLAIELALAALILTLIAAIPTEAGLG